MPAAAAWGQGAGRSQVFRSLALFHGPHHYVASAAGRVRLLEQHLEALLALEPQRRVRNFLRSARLLKRAGASRADRLDRHAHVSAAGAKGGRMAKHSGAPGEASQPRSISRPDLDGYPIGFHLTGGKASDSRTSKCSSTEACSLSRPCSACILFCKSSSPMADIKGRSLERLWPKRFRTSRDRIISPRWRSNTLRRHLLATFLLGGRKMGQQDKCFEVKRPADSPPPADPSRRRLVIGYLLQAKLASHIR
jgi:hypothetical protein